VQDVLLGGQASLVPIGRILFAEYDYCMNLGVFLMYHLKKENRIAFDISPVKLNFYSNQLGFDYDDKENFNNRSN
jgi:anhydro-N-acetylmuramic acid kinase